MRILIIALLFIISFLACKDETLFVPKPRMYPKINYPQKAYHQLKVEACPFKMETPIYFEYVKDNFDEEAKRNECWFDLYSSNLNAYIHFSYLNINNRKHLDKLINCI